MNLLAIETSTPACSVALCVGGQSFYCEDVSARSHSNALLPMVEALLSEACISLSDLNAIALANGPGSFTGLRIGISAAQGLAFGQDIPVIPISSLAIVAKAFETYCERNKLNLAIDTVVSTIDARTK